jgi:hypothetical protein
MFYDADVFDQDLSGWCVSKINSKPTAFAVGSPLYNETGHQPIWGKCPDK